MTQPTLPGGFDLKVPRGLLSPRAPLEKLLRAVVNSLASGKRSPHCYSAHVQGKGYVDEGNDPATRAEYLRQLTRDVQSEVDNMGYAPAYAEPGYSDPARGILFADWNKFPRGFDQILEYAGYAVEWADEWGTCESCNKAIRTSPDSYDWSQAYADVGDDCAILCGDCIVDDPAEYLKEITGDPDRCVTHAMARRIDLESAGYTRYSAPAEYETGFHPGQTDDPRKVAEQIAARGIDSARILFVQAEQSQFYIRWEVWLKDEDDDDSEDDSDPPRTSSDVAMERIAREDSEDSEDSAD